CAIQRIELVVTGTGSRHGQTKSNGPRCLPLGLVAIEWITRGPAVEFLLVITRLHIGQKRRAIGEKLLSRTDSGESKKCHADGKACKVCDRLTRTHPQPGLY